MALSRITIRQFEAFVAVADTLSFGPAIVPVEVVDNITTALGIAAQGLAATLAPAYVGLVARPLGLAMRRVTNPEAIRQVCLYRPAARAAAGGRGLRRIPGRLAAALARDGVAAAASGRELTKVRSHSVATVATRRPRPRVSVPPAQVACTVQLRTLQRFGLNTLASTVCRASRQAAVRSPLDSKAS